MPKTKDFQIPQTVAVEQETLTPTYGKFVAEPFERGFGATIGNALRRILLSSIPGAAVTSMKIEGVFHEFSAIPGVKEDVTEIVLNLKNLRLKLHADKVKEIHIKKKGPCVVTGKDIIHDADVQIASPDLHIMTLDKDGHVDMAMQVKIGRGYVPAERNKEEGASIGVIPIDAIFSPIRRVNIATENARVGRMTDYDKLTIEIWTDSGIGPEDALRHAAQIFRDHILLFTGPEDLNDPAQPHEGETTQKGKNMERSVGDLQLSMRALNGLKNADIHTIADLISKTESEIMKTKNFGEKSLDEIKAALQNMGLSLAVEAGTPS